MIFLFVFLQLVVYFVCGFVLGLIEKMNFIKYKAQIKDTFVNMFMYNIIPRYIFYSNINGNLLIPNFSEFLINSLLYMLVQDIIFWIIHKTIHMEPFYTWIHKQHHSTYVTHTYGIFGKYMSGWDYVMFELLNMPLKIIFYNKSIVSMWTVDTIDYIMTVFAHSKVFDLDAHHKMHHRHQEYNFGITRISDTFFRSLYKKNNL